jgi:hypothetical protein
MLMSTRATGETPDIYTHLAPIVGWSLRKEGEA